MCGSLGQKDTHWVAEDNSGVHLAEGNTLGVQVDTIVALKEQKFSILPQAERKKICEDFCFFFHLPGRCAHFQVLSLSEGLQWCSVFLTRGKMWHCGV